MTAARSQGTLAAALDHAMQRYCDRHPRSAERQAHAAKDLPGGSTRSAIYYTPFPLTWVEGRGNRLIDLDGNECLDFLGEYSAGLYGHSNEIIRAAIAKAANAGLALGGPNIYEGPLAAAIRERFPSVDLIRFTNSGTEANLMALVTVRALNPSRTRIMVFDGGYHGGVFHFRHGCSALNVPFDWLIAEYNDIEGTRRLLNANASSLCGVIVEPMLGGGCIPGTRAFLGMLREECSANAVPLIFDEVMTSRLSPSGLQGLLGLRPDMTTFGKYLGGGASFGAFGGRREIMERFDPGHASAFQHAGTFNNNVISMAAGLAGLTQVYSFDEAKRINALGDYLRSAINTIAAERELLIRATGVGSLIGLHFQSLHQTTAREDGRLKSQVREDALLQLETLFHLEMIDHGFFFGRRGYISLSLPTTTSDCDSFVAAVSSFFEEHKPSVEATLHHSQFV
ncbi:MAG: aminotransferase class III-fold pyridoxal phosphate-dependent enzyme [Steroidobacteraceae bacterium]|jgi:glutamate-1-semialdehyde 2,1-aminomutase